MDNVVLAGTAPGADPRPTRAAAGPRPAAGTVEGNAEGNGA